MFCAIMFLVLRSVRGSISTPILDLVWGKLVIAVCDLSHCIVVIADCGAGPSVVNQSTFQRGFADRRANIFSILVISNNVKRSCYSTSRCYTIP